MFECFYAIGYQISIFVSKHSQKLGVIHYTQYMNLPSRRSIFQAEFNRSEFFFSKTSCHTNIKEPSLPY